MVPNLFVDYKTVQRRIAGIKPTAYARTRNHLDGSVTHLSAFITHGIVSTAAIARVVLKSHSANSSEKFLSELAWREYFHRFWQVNGNDIFTDLKQAQEQVSSDQLPDAIAKASTSIKAIDTALYALKTTGYMHNHARLWLAALICNIGHTHWYQPSRWLYYHLLDGDLASNSLSWQWVVGTFNHRKYIANQNNLNRFSETEQHNTFLDVSYEELANIPTPEVLRTGIDVDLSNTFPESTALPVTSSSEPIFLYSIWNLDPDWHRGHSGKRILWIEPEMHNEFALSPLRWKFVKHWADAIDGLSIFVGNKETLFPSGTDHLTVYTREYPATTHWPGRRDERDWCYELPDGTLKSFSNYWRKVRKTSGLFTGE